MKNKSNNKLLGVPLQDDSRHGILEKIIKYTSNPSTFFHVVSLNPENIVVSQNSQEFKKVLTTAQIRLNDGIGIVLAARLLGLKAGPRLTGVDLMGDLMAAARNKSLRVLLIGGKKNLANELAECYQRVYPEAKFKGIEGLQDVKNPGKDEEKRIFSIVTVYKPHFVIAAFGSPDQELWLARHSKQLAGTVAMGVGGGFDFLSGKISRAPALLRTTGLEWLYRLVRQPWRWKRQLRLITFIYLVLREKLRQNGDS